MKLKRNLRTTLQKFVKDPGSTFKFMSRFSDSMEQEFYKLEPILQEIVPR